MNFDKWTTAAAEAIVDTQKIADDHSATSIEIDHFLVALLQNKSSFIHKIFQKIGQNTSSILSFFKKKITNFPKVEGGQRTPSRDFSDMIRNAEKVQSKMGDSYLAIDHL